MKYQEAASLVLGRLQASQGDGRWNDHLSLATWEWPQGVAMYALLQRYEAQRDPALLSTISDWYAGHLSAGLPAPNINTTAPMLGLALLYELTRDPRWEEPIRTWARWVMTGLPRTEEGGFQHVTSDLENRGQLWDDTLFMTVLFLYRAGRALGEKAWVDEARYQFLLHIKYLHDTKTGLWFHGWSFEGRHHFGRALWARGNAWFTAGGVDFASWLDEDDPVRRLVLESWREQCAALKACQDTEGGLWHTLLNHPDSYLETSASAAIAYGLHKGCRLGLLDSGYRDCAEKAIGGVIRQIAPDGTVQGVSYGTPVGADENFYRTIPIKPTAYGQGLTYLMLTEAERGF
ncbi:MAG: glycoside hydrolase family 88 protein [Clostridia bacterium]|nr:glycoside hydrolase family 88 protein [Clostridia bacterium]